MKIHPVDRLIAAVLTQDRERIRILTAVDPVTG